MPALTVHASVGFSTMRSTRWSSVECSTTPNGTVWSYDVVHDRDVALLIGMEREHVGQWGVGDDVTVQHEDGNLGCRPACFEQRQTATGAERLVGGLLQVGDVCRRIADPSPKWSMMTSAR